MGVFTLHYNTATVPTVNGAAVVPLLNGVPTDVAGYFGGVGDAAGFTSLTDIAAFVNANTSSITFTGRITSVTAIATPSALVATTFTGFASTVSGAVLMGFGTTYDVTLKNRAGTDAFGVTANTVDVVAAGALTVTNAITVQGLTVGLGFGAIARNSAFGLSALGANVSGVATTAIGYQALRLATAANSCVAVGDQALQSNLTGGQNVAIGASALGAATSGNNTAVGHQALSTGGAISGNVALGYNAGKYEAGSSAFYVDNQDRTNTAGDKAGALLYGTFNATPASQTLRVNAAFSSLFSILSVSPTLGVGYATGAGGTVTQGSGSGKATAFTLSKVSGQITTDNAVLNAGVIVSSVWTNTAIAATDTVVINHVSGGTVGSYTFNVQCGAGTATLNIRNATAGNLTEALVLQFTVIKGVNA